MSSQGFAVIDVQSAVSQAVVRVLTSFYGKGPARTRSYVFDDYVFCVCEDVLTPAELELRASGDDELVQELRVAFEDVMAGAFAGEVQAVVGRTVVAYHSQVIPSTGMLFEAFVLDPTQPGIAVGDGAVGGADELDHEPGAPGDADALPSPGEQEPPTLRVDAPRPRPVDHGELRAALSAALVRCTQQVFGRGPSRARTYLADRYVVCAMENGLTRAEQTLAAGGRGDLVRKLRRRLLARDGDRHAAAVEGLAGRRVVAAECQVVFDPDVVFLVFVLEE